MYICELTEEERTGLALIPDDAVEHWWRGEKWDFREKVWIAQPSEEQEEQ